MQFPIHEPQIHWRQKAPKVGKRYEGPDQLKECLSYYALANGYSLWYERTSKSHIIARCGVRPPKLSKPEKGGQKKSNRYQPSTKTCKWRLAASWMTTERSFQVKKLTEEHTRVRNFKYGTLINYKWIGRHFADRIRQQPDIKCSLLQELVMKKYKCFVTQQRVKRARLWALNEYERSLEEHYAMLRPYADALLRTNAGSIVQLGTTTNPDGKTYFDRFYVCLFGLKEGFKKGCRREVALYGCFLKTSCKGELLTAGLLEAIKEVMPRAEHKQCARYIYENFRKVYSGVEYRNLFWKAAKSTYPAQFDDVMKEIKASNPNAFKYLMERNPKSWCRAFFDTTSCCEAVENGYSEC
uniref:uncharacterized protein LOC122587969 n=1 Tax=Erigeron canadensis TaxID=72917 RepID=UPI001CB8C643|nr:uncharacterized protein LOC122587969 [Erigeron canadensis]